VCVLVLLIEGILFHIPITYIQLAVTVGAGTLSTGAVVGTPCNVTVMVHDTTPPEVTCYYSFLSIITGKGPVFFRYELCSLLQRVLILIFVPSCLC
jgi:hypothetical protein